VGTDPANLLLLALLLLVACALSFEYFEKPLIRAGRRIADGFRGPAAGPAEAADGWPPSSAQAGRAPSEQRR
jgi:peptidoglycan/LPS O-acetylase OafA/YrhL